MFFCCEQSQGNGKHALEVFDTPKNLSTISEQKSIRLQAYIPANNPNRSQMINSISHNQKGASLNNIMSVIRNNQGDFQDFVLKKVMKSDYQRLANQYRNTNKQWTDPEFKPEQKSFGLGRNTEKVEWRRVGQVIKKPVFIGNQISPSDILQGRIGDCYFLSAIAGLAEKDHRIKSVFPNLEINKNGIYMARILHKGVLREVVVDDYFPVSKKDGRFMGANPAGGTEIWVIVLQKCWAKLYGSYDAIDGGLPNEVLHAFSGAPTFQYLMRDSSPQELDQIFNNITDAQKSAYVVCCGTNSQQNIEEMGLVQGHAYTIIDAHHLPYKLLKIRNPWGEKQWIGRCSDNDTQFWNKISKKDKIKYGYQDVDDGVFFMLWEDFIVYFSLVNICKIDDKANYYYDEITYPKEIGVFSCLETKGGFGTIAIAQQNTRSLKVPAPRYATSTVIIAKKVETNQGVDYKYISSLTKRNVCQSNIEVSNLNDGEYIIYSSLIGRSPTTQGTISCYCQSPVQLTPISTINNDQFLHRIFLDHARNNIQNQQRIFGNMDVWVCMDIIYDSGFGYTVVHIGNGVKLKLGLTFNQEEYIESNFELLPPFKDSGTFKIVCDSGQDSIVLCRIIPQNYAISASMPIPNIKRLC